MKITTKMLETAPATICSIKKEFLSLQCKMEHAKANLDINCCSNQDIFMKMNILNEARVLLKELLDAHDQKRNCTCFINNLRLECDNSSSEGGQQEMLKHFKTLKKLLGQLDIHIPEADSEIKPFITKSRLNPLSKSFVPSTKMYRLIENCFMSSGIYASATGAWLSHNSNELHKMYKTPISAPSFRSRHGSRNRLEENVPNRYYLNSEIRKLWKRTKEQEGEMAMFPCLVTCFYGLNRHSSTTRPTVRLPRRLRRFTSIWSVGLEDRKLWNNRTVEAPCGCPPSFGYNIPPDTFGNPFNLKIPCRETGIHMSYYDACKENELDTFHDFNSFDISCKIFNENLENVSSESEIFLDNEQDRLLRLKGYKKSFEQFVEEICLITKEIENLSELNKEIYPRGRQEAASVQVAFDENRFGTRSIRETKNLVGNRNEASDFIDVMSILPVVSGESSIFNIKARNQDTGEGVSTVRRTACDPPCSVWCDSKKMPKRDAKEHLNINPVASQKVEVKRDKNIYDTILKTICTSKKSCSSLNQTLVQQTSTIFNTEHWNDVKLNEYRLRHDSGDSGYSSLSHSEQDSKPPPPCPTGDTFFNCCNNDLSSMGYDTEYWKPLPECIPDSESNSNGEWNQGSRRNAKSRRPRQRNDCNKFKENGLSANAKKQQSNQSNDVKPDVNKWKFYEKDFPALKKCKSQ